MLPPESILIAAARWADLLERSSYVEAAGLLGAESTYADLTQTQYATALEWLASLEVAEPGPNGYKLSTTFAGLPREQRALFLFTRALEDEAPRWLQDADVLVPAADAMPVDGALLASALNLAPEEALTGIRQVQGHIDLELRNRIGAAGELALVELLESYWAGSTTHIARDHDGYGYDIAFRDQEGQDWHLEVKSTTRSGRLVIHLSRHEHDRAGQDHQWRLIVLGLDDEDQIRALATARHPELLRRSPRDVDGRAHWQSARFELSDADLDPGLRFVPCITERHGLLAEGLSDEGSFAWMPGRAARAAESSLTAQT